MTTIKAQLLAVQDGQYTVYVFDNLNEEPTSEAKYIMCTKLPNWNFNEHIEIGDIGFLQCKHVQEGDIYYCVASGEQMLYKYSNCYFINFIKLKDEIINKEFKF